MTSPAPSAARPPGPRAWAVQVATAGGADTELAADALWQAGATAIEERAGTDGVLLVAATGGADPRPLVDAVAGQWTTEIVALDVDAALDAWRPHARAVVAGRFVVRPPWVPGPDAPSRRAGEQREVMIDPGRAFGSGAHPSTRLALGAMDRLMAAGDRVLDVGCGSGVLAIAALVGGAAAAVAVDNDPQALAASRANAARNAVADRLTVADRLPGSEAAPAGAAAEKATVTYPRTLSGGPPVGPFDLVVANMLSPTLIELAPAIRPHLGPGANLVLSGLLPSQRPAVLAAYPGLAPVGADEVEGWLALVLR